MLARKPKSLLFYRGTFYKKLKRQSSVLIRAIAIICHHILSITAKYGIKCLFYYSYQDVDVEDICCNLLFGLLNTTLSREHLNDAINKLFEWSNIWQLQIAVDKCFVCSIHTGNQRSNANSHNYVLNTHVLEQVDVVRDLGVHVDCSPKFDRHISLIVHRAMTRARLIISAK